MAMLYLIEPFSKEDLTQVLVLLNLLKEFRNTFYLSYNNTGA